MVTMVVRPGSNVTCLNCEIIDFEVQNKQKIFFLFTLNLIPFISIE